MIRRISVTEARAAPAAREHGRAMLAHDLRGALQGVSGGLAMLETADVTPEIREQFDRMAAATRTLACLIGLVDDEDAAHAEDDARCRSVDVPGFVSFMERRYRGEARERGRSFHIETGPNPPATLAVDQTSLARALGNLIGNALTHGGKRVRLVLRGSAEDGVAFEVHDDGAGFPARAIGAPPGAARLPLPGSAPADGNGNGHGLGLRIARGLAAEMGGTLVLENRAEGAFAALAFPADLCRPAAADPAAAAASKPRPDLGGSRVLLAEDNPTNQMVATQMLRALNAEVTLSADGVEALERFEADEFDLLVVDIEMPRMSGLDVIRTIRARGDRRAEVPIVALTAYAMREHREQIAAAGANGLISKPIISVDALGEALAAHLPGPAAEKRPPGRAEPAPPGGTDADPVADLVVYEALCAAIGAGMMAELLDKVVADLLEARADLARAVVQLDRGVIAAASHILISVAGAVGAVRLQACARRLNRAAHGEDDAALPAEVARCIDEVDAAVSFARSRRSET